MARIRIDDLPVAENLTPEQEALILGAGLKSFRPSLEHLETREVPTVSFGLANGVLTIQGDATENKVTVIAREGNLDKGEASHVVEVSGTYWQGETLAMPKTAVYDASQVKRIEFNGQGTQQMSNGGKDTFTNMAYIPYSVDGETTDKTDTLFVHLREYPPDRTL
jgi:hypothetical protein